MANKHPKLENLTSLARVSERKLGPVVGTRYPLAVAEALGKVSDHQQFIREAVEQALKAQGLLPEGDTAA